MIVLNKTVGTMIPGIRKERNVMANTAISDGKGLSEELLQELLKHGWNKKSTSWSQCLVENRKCGN